MQGAPSWKIGTLDVVKTLKVACYFAAAAALTYVGQAVSGADFSSVDVAGVNGTVIATGIVNVLMYVAKRLAQDTSEQIG